MIPYGLFDAIPKVFYLLTMSLLSIIDLFQLLMRKLAGLDCYYVDDTAQSGDIVYDFLTGIFTGSYPILSTVFWGLVILGFILLFLSTLIAIIRSEYTTEKADNGKGKIMFKAFKSVIFFALVPIVTIVGVYLANVVLVAVDKATTPNTNNYSSLDTSKLQTVKVVSYSFGQENVTETYVTYSLFGLKNENDKDTQSQKALPYGTTTTTFSGTIFKASAYSANRVRTTANNEWTDTVSQSKNFAQLLNAGAVTNFSGLFTETSLDTEKLAAKIDVAFADNVVFATAQELDFDTSDYIKDTNNLSGDPFPTQRGETQVCADKFNVQLVWYYYDLWQFNYIIGIGAAVICATIFINIIFGLMRRIIEMIGLFLIAPPLIGLMPLDNEKAYGNWRSNFIGKALMAYGAIGGMNIIFVLLPELQTIKFFNVGPIDWIVDTLLVLVALLAIKDFIALISKLVGGEDANSVGEKVGKDVGDLAGKAVKIGATVVGGAASVAMTGAKVVGKGAKLANYGYRQTRNFAGEKLSEWEGHETANKIGKALKTSNLSTAKARREHRAEDMAAAEQSVLDANFERYRNDTQKVRDAETAAIGVYGAEHMKQLKENDGAKYQELIDQQLRKHSDYEARQNPDFKDNVDAKFMETQANRNVSMKKLAQVSDVGQGVAQIGAFGRDMKNSKGLEKLYALKSGLGQAGGWAGYQVADVGKPVVSGAKNVLSEVGSIYTSNSFYEGFMGKDKDTLADTAFRLAGTNKKAHDKLKTKTKEQDAEIKKLKQQQEMLINALRQVEAERHKH